MTTHRRDGRLPTDTRRISISYDGLGRVDGSARFGFGETTAALASISGPIEVRLAAELPSKATFEVLVRPLSNVPATESKSLATTIRSNLEPSLILTKNPRSLVQLVIQSLTPSRARSWTTTLAAAMINASSLALLNASSVPMRGVVAAVAVARTSTSSSGKFIVDPSDEELEASTGYGCFAFLFADAVGLDGANADCVWASWRSGLGGHDELEVLEAKKVGLQGAEVVYQKMRQSISTVFGQDPSEVEGDAIAHSQPESDDEKMII